VCAEGFDETTSKELDEINEHVDEKKGTLRYFELYRTT